MQAQKKGGDRVDRRPESDRCGVDLAEQTQDVLRSRVGDRQNVRGGVDQDLRAGQVRRFGGEVRVADLAFGRGVVLQGDAQGTDGGADGVGLERAQTTAELGHLLDCIGDDGLRRVDRSGDHVGAAAGSEV